MAKEIELKAHVGDSEALRRILFEKAEYSGAFEKDDTYWFPGPNSSQGAQGLPPSGLRLRREKRTFPGGTERAATYATFKRKKVVDGMEINDEYEFEVISSPYERTSVFEEFLAMMGLKPGFSKRKRGWTFSHDGINAELLELEGLGWFIELEIIRGSSNEEASYKEEASDKIEEKRKQLLDFLDSLGVSREAIESRFYSEMLNSAKTPGE